MFTGLVSAIGEVTRVAASATGREFVIAAPWPDVVVGESIAVDGACLTVTAIAAGSFTAAAMTTTLARTTLGTRTSGDRVNLERALRAADRLGGHIVQGHVDGVATVIGVRRLTDAMLLDLEVWEGAETLCVPRGSIAVDGVSLTIAELSPSGRGVSVALIQHTQRHTTLGARREGDVVNVELDVIGKYVRHMLAPWGAGAGATS